MHLHTLAGSAVAAALLWVGAAVAATTPDGSGVFAQNCSACHQLTGKGIPGAFPALAGDPYVTGDPHKVIGTLLNGRGGMPSFRSDLDDAHIAAAITYIRSSWGNQAPPVEAADVARQRGANTSENPGDSLQSH